MDADDQPPQQAQPPTNMDVFIAQRQEYIAQRTAYIAARQDSIKSFDQAMITLSAGLLALSITFFEKFIGNRPAQYHQVLGAAWVFLLLALLATLISFHTSQAAWQEQIQLLDQSYSGANAAPVSNVPSRLTGLLNWVSIVLFVIGVGCLIAFVLYNLPNTLPTDLPAPSSSPSS